MQRLFSTFPVGAAGYGLLILRLCATGLLLREGAPHTLAALPVWGAAALIGLAILLFMGAFTPVGCLASGLAQVGSLYVDNERDIVALALSLGVTSAVFLLGPGAFSVDCRLFGRRLILRSLK